MRKKLGINPITLIDKDKSKLENFMGIFFLIIIFVWLAEILLYTLPINITIFPWPMTIQLINYVPLKIAGLVIIVIGFVIFIMAIINFGESWRVGIDENSPGDLITNGIFSFSRNPIFFYIDLYYIGTFLINGSYIFLVFAICVIIGLHVHILNEEKSLEKIYGQIYLDYKNKTGRYITLHKN